MPIYDYSCPNCPTTLKDQLVKVNAVLPECPDCKTTMTKDLASTMLYFSGRSGEGFYKAGWSNTKRDKK